MKKIARILLVALVVLTLTLSALGSNRAFADPPTPTEPCGGEGEAPCGQGDGGNGNPGNGSDHANCNADQGEVDPDCEEETEEPTDEPTEETPTEVTPTEETPTATEELCNDPAALNNGQSLPCEYPPTDPSPSPTVETPTATSVQMCTDEDAENYGYPMPCVYSTTTVTGTPSATPVVTSTPSPEEEEKKVEKKKVTTTDGVACSTCFTGFVYVVDQETDLKWIDNVTALGPFTIQISAQDGDNWIDDAVDFAIEHGASVILVWDELPDQKWITTATSELYDAGVTCLTFAFSANEDPSWIPEAQQISVELMR